jgi:hypothetical protein
MDALRIMMKEVLKDLWLEWDRASKCGRQPSLDNLIRPATASPANVTLMSRERIAGLTIMKCGRQQRDENQACGATASPATA